MYCVIACLIVSDISVALLPHADLLVLSNLLLTLAALHLWVTFVKSCSLVIFSPSCVCGNTPRVWCSEGSPQMYNVGPQQL